MLKEMRMEMRMRGGYEDKGNKDEERNMRMKEMRMRGSI